MTIQLQVHHLSSSFDSDSTSEDDDEDHVLTTSKLSPVAVAVLIPP